MPDLATLQALMGEAVREGTASEHLLDAIVDHGLTAEERLQVHMNTYRETLVSALNSVFPLSEVFVGRVFLREALRQFVLLEPPKEPMLFRYGRAFPVFLRDYEATQTIPYIADLAKLEWLTHELQNADENTPLKVNECENLEALQVSPCVRFLSSDFPIFDLWRVGTGQLQPEDVDINAGGQVLLIILNEGQIFYQLVEPQAAAVLERISNGASVPENEAAMLSSLLAQGVLFAPEKTYLEEQ